MQEAVTASHEASTAFSEEVMKEHTVFELSKRQEMKELLQNYADGQVDMLQRGVDEWDRVSVTLADM
jgi:sorting nexin-4